MTQIPAGWYPDPAPETAPGRQRFWDGARWTEHVHDPQPTPPPPRYPPSYPQAYAPTYAPRPAPTTPDGQPLASWWERVAASLIDGVIVNVLALAIWIPVAVDHWDEVRDWFDAVDRLDPETDDNLPRLPDFINPTAGLFWEIVAFTAVLGAVYVVGFWRWKQATPGKLVMGLRIRRREAPGGLPWSAIWVRYGFTLLVSLFGPLYLLDVLWPLWDDRRQALHDKAAGTNVVSVRRSDADSGSASDSEPRSDTATDGARAGLPSRW